MNATTLFYIITISIIIYIAVYNARNNCIQQTCDNEKNIKLFKSFVDLQTNSQDFIEFVFTMQDLYPINPPQFIEMTTCIDTFSALYTETMNDIKRADANYGIMNNLRITALYALASLIHNAPFEYISKLEQGTAELDNIMMSYLDNVREYQQVYTYYNGYTTKTKLPHVGPSPANAPNDHDLY